MWFEIEAPSFCMFVVIVAAACHQRCSQTPRTRIHSRQILRCAYQINHTFVFSRSHDSPTTTLLFHHFHQQPCRICVLSFAFKQPVFNLQPIKQRLLSMQLSILIYKPSAQQELLTWLVFCQVEELRALRPFPKGVAHLWLHLALWKELSSSLLFDLKENLYVGCMEI